MSNKILNKSLIISISKEAHPSSEKESSFGLDVVLQEIINFFQENASGHYDGFDINEEGLSWFFIVNENASTDEIRKTVTKILKKYPWKSLVKMSLLSFPSGSFDETFLEWEVLIKE